MPPSDFGDSVRREFCGGIAAVFPSRSGGKCSRRWCFWFLGNSWRSIMVWPQCRVAMAEFWGGYTGANAAVKEGCGTSMQRSIKVKQGRTRQDKLGHSQAQIWGGVSEVLR